MIDSESLSSHRSSDAGATFEPGQSPFHTKGIMWMGLRSFIDDKTPGGIDAVTASLTPALRDFFTQMFLPTAWYDLFPITSIAEAAAAAMNLSRLDYVKRSAEWHAEQDMKGVYKALLMLNSPIAVCRRFGSLHQQIYDFGKAGVVREETNKVHSIAVGMPEPIVWWWKRASECYVQRVLRAAGARSPSFVWHPHEPDGERDGVPLVRLPSSVSWT